MKERVKNAKDFLSKMLINLDKGKVNSQDEKFEVLNALKIQFCDEIKINEEKVKYVSKYLNNSQAIMEVKELEGEDYYFINIDKSYLAEVTIPSLIATISHEWGHINQYELEKRGEQKLEGVDIDEAKESLLDWWQQLGLQCRYDASEEEYDATMFAVKNLYIWLANASKLGLDKNAIKKQLIKVKKIETTTNRTRRVGQAKYKVWKTINGLLKIEEEDAMFDDLPDGMSEEEFIYNNNLKVFEEFGKADEEELKATIKKIEGKAQRRDKKLNEKSTIKQRYSDEKLLLTDCYINLLALKCGLKQEELGIKLGESNELFEFTYSREKNPSSPLYGYLNLSVRNMQGLTTTDYARILNKYMTQLNHKISQVSSEDNQSEKE